MGPNYVVRPADRGRTSASPIGLTNSRSLNELPSECTRKCNREILNILKIPFDCKQGYVFHLSNNCLEGYNVQGAVFQLIFMDITSSDLVLKMKYSGDIQSEVVIPDLL